MSRHDPREVRDDETIESLREQGYHRVSRKHRHAARLDRPDWQEHLFNTNRMDNRSHGTRTLAGYYIRCTSQDVIQFPEHRMSEFLTLENDWHESIDRYVPQARDEVPPCP